MKNKKPALILRSLEPQTPIIKNIGSKMLSKKIKNDIISIAEKDKSKKISRTMKYRQKSVTLLKVVLYEVSKHKGIINVVSNIKNKEIPSIPKEIFPKKLW